MVERTDIKLTEDLGAELNARGDASRVTERVETVTQRAVLRSLNVTYDERGTRLTPQSVEDVRDRVERALRDDDIIDVDVSVSVDDTSTNTLTLAVTLGDVDTLTLDIDV